MTLAPLRPERVPPGRLARLALEYWERTGGGDVFPRRPERRLSLAWPVTRVRIPRLDTDTLVAWLQRNEYPAIAVDQSRRLHGCLYTYQGETFLFYDSTDTPETQRFTVAHELGHYLIEVWEPRERVRLRLGKQALEVLDGERPATWDERLDALLADVPLGVLVHLMTRDEDGTIGCDRVATAECAADEFALELLAPRALLRDRVRATTGLPWHQRYGLVGSMLRNEYGLPDIQAGGYAKTLVNELTGGESVREWLSL